jgi:NADP-dependent 3-hydroxy acid dehydrogenase YdfG
MIVTGASSGIGEAVALALAREGATVVLAARRKGRLDRVAARIRARGGSALVVPTDLTDHDQVKCLVTRTTQAFGRIDVLFNAAGWGHYD